MKPKLAWAFATLPILGIALIYLIQHNSAQPKTKVPVNIHLSPTNSKTVNSNDMPEQKIPKNVWEGLDSSMTKVAEVMTPQLISQMADFEVKCREPSYRAFFEKNHLDKNKADEVIAIVRDREVHHLEAMHDNDAKGADENGMKGARDYRDSLEIEKHLYDLQLRNILGETRFRLFSELETSITRAVRQAGKKSVDKMMND